MNGICAMESLAEDTADMNFIICPAVIEDCDQIYELVQVKYRSMHYTQILTFILTIYNRITKIMQGGGLSYTIFVRFIVLLRECQMSYFFYIK